MFTMPFGMMKSAGDPFWDNVVLYLPMTGANGSTTFTDVSKYGHTVTRNGDAVISTAQAPPLTGVGSSGYFDGSIDSLSIPDHASWDLSGDFTIRAFIYCSSHPSVVYFLGQVFSNAFAPILPYIGSGRVGIAASSTGSSWFVNNLATGAPTLSLNQWHYIVWRRSGNTWDVQINATVYPIGGGTYSGTPYTSSQPMLIGGANSIYYFHGYLSHIQILSGVALPSSTVPTAPFPIG